MLKLKTRFVSQNQPVLLVALILAAITMIAYLPALGGGFLWDDAELIVNQPCVTGSSGWGAIWSGATPDYYPLTYSLFRLEWMLWGPWTPGYHAVNILLHSVAAILVWRILFLLSIPGAWWGAALFALHPVNVASVAWISETKNTLSLPLALGASLLFLSSQRGLTPRRSGLNAGSAGAMALLLFLMSLLAKSSGVTLPLAWLILLRWKQGRFSLSSLLSTAPYLVLSAVSGLCTLWFQHHHAIKGWRDPVAGFTEKSFRAMESVGFYLKQILLPWDLSMLYATGSTELLAFGSLLALALGVAATLLCLKRRSFAWWWVAGFGCFLILLLPVLGFLPMYYLRLSPVADHWLYLPGIPLFAMAGSALALLARDRLILYLPCLLLLGLLGSCTWTRCHDLRDTLSLWRSVIRHDPRSWYATMNLSMELDDLGQKQEALESARRALELGPSHPETHLNLATLLALQDQPMEALEVLRSAKCRLPIVADILVLEGTIQARMGMMEQAATSFTMALNTNPGHLEALQKLVDAASQLGRPELVVEKLHRYLLLHPNTPTLWNDLGIALANSGAYRDAEKAFQQGLQFHPEDQSLQENLKLLRLSLQETQDRQ
jgi:tetratricopeptide (TPR) repeat protein